MEREIQQNRIFNESYKRLIGSFIECWPETGGHITIYYVVNIPNLRNEQCSSCKRNQPLVVRHERDHMAQEFYDILCTNCTPKRIIDKLRTGDG